METSPAGIQFFSETPSTHGTKRGLRLASQHLFWAEMKYDFGPTTDLIGLLKMAAQARDRGEYQKGFDLLDQARRMYPSAIPPFIELGKAHGQRHDYTTARRYFDEAVKLSGRNPKVSQLIGINVLEMGQHKIAEEYFLQAAKRNDAEANVFAHLADIYEHQNLVDEAAKMVDRALKKDPRNAASQMVKAKLERRAGKLEEAEKTLRSFLSSPSDNEAIPRFWYELGNNLDRMGRYDEAMDAFLKAKALILPSAGPDQERLLRTRSNMRVSESTVLLDVVERWSKIGEQLQPRRRFTALAGHPRSGTTLLEQVLDAHPDIVSADENRIFLEESFRPLTRRFPPNTPLLTMTDTLTVPDLLQMRSNYFKFIEVFMGQTVGDRMLIEKNPALGGFVPAFMLIFPEVRFLVAIRDPRDVCMSCFMQSLSLNPVSSAYLTLEGTIEQYISSMSMWRVMLPRMRNPHLLVRYEDVLENLEAESRRTLEFLEIPWDERVLKFHEHAQKKIVRSPTYSDVTKPIFKTAKGRWQNYQKYLEPYLKKLDPFLKLYGYE